MRASPSPLVLALLAGLAGGCGARTPARDLDAAAPDAAPPPRDSGLDAFVPDAFVPDAFVPDAFVPDAFVPDAFVPGCLRVDDRCGPAELCGNGEDDDCDGRPDEDCPCAPGSVQPCFLGPPGRRNVGACRDGEQVCEVRGTWGQCVGGIAPTPSVCNGQDNLCDGCSQMDDCPLDCPGAGDPRVPDGRPFEAYELRGPDFYPGPAAAWSWTVEGGPCDRIAARLRSYDLDGPRAPLAVLRPRLSGEYTIGLSVTRPDGEVLSCSWIVHVAGPGLRVEMCYPESEDRDLDLFLHRPDSTTPWYPRGATAFEPNQDSCGWFNCEAVIRGTIGPGRPVPRADWGYPPSDLSECVGGPQGDRWSALGFCANPRLDIDNNLAEGTGLPENINVDAPGDGATYRIMIQNFSGSLTHPLVNVYCSGRRTATLGAVPDEVQRFQGRDGNISVGAMWRVADVTTHVDASGRTTCDVALLHPPGTTTGYDVTYDDPRY